MDLTDYKVVEAKKPIRIQDLKDRSNYIAGEYLGFEDGPYSPIYLVRTRNEIKKILGVTDLQQKMEQIEIGQRVCIGFEGERVTEQGHTMLIAWVGVLPKVEQQAG